MSGLRRSSKMISCLYFVPCPASQNRARIVYNCRTVKRSSPDVISDPCTLYGALCSVIEHRRDDIDSTLYEIRARKDHRCVDLISDALPFGRLWYDGPEAVVNAIGYANFTADHIMQSQTVAFAPANIPA